MSDDPVVEMVNAILNGEDNFVLLLQRPQLEQIRDEIVALRRYRLENDEALEVIRRASALIETTPKVSDAKRKLRNEALEEAARICDLDDCVRIKASALAADIRALKEETRDAVAEYSLK